MEFKKINGFNYSVNSLGEVFSHHSNKLLKLRSFGNNYNYVTLSNKMKQKKFYVHRLVAEYFLNNSKNKTEVNHIDGNKLNNNVSNLEWVTKSENMKHSFEVLGNPRIDYINWKRSYQKNKPNLVPKNAK